MNPQASGVLIVDKPAGISSAQAVARVKKIFNVAKVGHCGTLDPFATGLLVCCLNQATRLSRFLLNADKTYEAVLHLGVATDTQDATGEALGGSDPGACEARDLDVAFGRYLGEIEQIPPAYSALKHHGVPLYRLARKGRPVHKPPRRVRITDLQITRVRLPRVHFRVTCSAGTYIRTLCADIGRDMGCGGHLAALRRVASGGFAMADAVTLDALQRLPQAQRLARLISMSAAVAHLPACLAGQGLITKLYHGVELGRADLAATDLRHHEGPVKIVDKNDNLLAIVAYDRQKAKIGYCCVFPPIIALAMASI